MSMVSQAKSESFALRFLAFEGEFEARTGAVVEGANDTLLGTVSEPLTGNSPVNKR